LQSAPDFHFTAATVTEIYAKFHRLNQVATNDLEIIDTRTADHTEKLAIGSRVITICCQRDDILNPADRDA
jgi:hypothetical protein